MYEDIYFLNSKEALRVASAQNRWGDNGYFLQACYYDGEKLESDLPNLIHLPIDNLLEDLAYGRYRIPTKINCEGLNLSNEIKVDVEVNFNFSINQVKMYRKQFNAQYLQNIRESKPNFKESIRFYLVASVSTQVMQYVSKNIVDTLVDMGYEICFELYIGIEDLSCFKIISEFKPHVTININHLNNEYLHEDVFNVIWFQDPMPILVNDTQVSLRNRDMIYSLSDLIMTKKFTKNMYEIQHFCVNGNIYFPNEDITRDNKIVFIGSSYFNSLNEHRNNEAVINSFKYLYAELQKGVIITKEYLQTVAQEYNLEYKFLVLVPYAIAVREVCVEWICTQDVIDVEVYGRHWEKNPIVNKFFKGELPHGKEVANIYNTAKYSLLAHSFDMYQQRLPEMSACGTIPVSYDVQGIIEDGYLYESSSLLFRNYEELLQSLSLTPKESVFNISEDMSFKKFVTRILDNIKTRVQDGR